MRKLEDLLTLDDEAVAAEEIGYAVLEVVEQQRTVDTLSPAQRRVMLVHLLNAEVCNGGFSLYFFNSWGDHATETAAALRQMGASRVADLLESAMADFGAGGPPRDGQARLERLRELERDGPRWLDLDQQFYEIHLDDLPDAILREVSAHREQFEGLPFETSEKTTKLRPRQFNLGEVLAERSMEFVSTAGWTKRIVVRIGRPVRDPEPPRNWLCPYQIEGMGTVDVRRVCPPEHTYDLCLSDDVRGAVGFDAMDALIQGLHAIPRDLALFTKAPGGAFVRHGEPDWTLVYACRNVLKDADSAFPSARR